MGSLQRSETERREYERYDLEFRVQVKWKDAFGNLKADSGTTKDISPSGAFIICNSPLDEGCQIDLEIDLPICVEGTNRSCVYASGKVVRRHPVNDRDSRYGHAIRFDSYCFSKI